MNKKANFADIVEYIHVVMILGFSIVIVMLFISNWTDAIVAMDNETIPMAAKVGISSLQPSLFNGFDWLFASMYVIFLGFSVASARLIPSSPKFVIVSFIAIIFLPLGALFVENIWSGFVQQTVIATVVNNMVFLPFMLDKLVYFVLFCSLAVAIALLTKVDVQGGFSG